MKNNLLASGIRLSLLTFISRILGLVREMTKASFLGTSALADAFSVAFMIPNLFRRLFAENSISVAFIPTFKSYLEKSSKAQTQDFLAASLTLVTFLTGSVVVIGIIATPWIIPFFISDVSQNVQPEMIFLTRVMFPYLLVISIAAFFQGILNGLKIFSPSGMTPILFNLFVIGFAYFFSPYTKNPARAMSYGVIAGGCVQAAFQIPFVLKQQWHISFGGLKSAFTNVGTKKVLMLIGPTVIGMAAYQINDVVSTVLAGKAGVGIVSSLQYSLRLQELILGVFAVSIGTVILPDLSGLATQKKWEDFTKMLIQAIKTIAFITIPITFFSLAFGENIIILIFQNNHFTNESVRLTHEAFNFHIVGLFFIALNRIISPAFYAQGNTKLPTLAGIFGFIINICLAIFLVQSMKGGGIALALTLASFGNTVFLIFFLKKAQTIQISVVLKHILLYSCKMVVISVLLTLPLVLGKSYIFQIFANQGRIISQGVPLALCAIIYALAGIIVLFSVKDPLALSILRVFVKKLRK